MRSVRSKRTIETVYLCGGTAKLPGLCEQLSHDLGVPVKLTKDGAVATYEIELSASEKEAFGKAVAANTELMNIARGFLG